MTNVSTYSFSVVSLGINIYSSASCNSSSVKCPTSISTHPTTTTSTIAHPAAQLLPPPGPTTPSHHSKVFYTFIHSEDIHVDVHIKTQYYDTVEVHTCTCTCTDTCMYTHSFSVVSLGINIYYKVSCTTTPTTWSNNIPNHSPPSTHLKSSNMKFQRRTWFS